jgi:hypothetical protein
MAVTDFRSCLHSPRRNIRRLCRLQAFPSPTQNNSKCSLQRLQRLQRPGLALWVGNLTSAGGFFLAYCPRCCNCCRRHCRRSSWRDYCSQALEFIASKQCTDFDKFTTGPVRRNRHGNSDLHTHAYRHHHGHDYANSVEQCRGFYAYNFFYRKYEGKHLPEKDLPSHVVCHIHIIYNISYIWHW